MDLETIQTLIDEIDYYKDIREEAEEELLSINNDTKIFAELYNEFNRKRTNNQIKLQEMSKELNELVAKEQRLNGRVSKKMAERKEYLKSEIEHLSKEVEIDAENKLEAQRSYKEILENKPNLEISKKIKDIEESIDNNYKQLEEIYNETLVNINKIDEEIENIKEQIKMAAINNELDKIESLSIELSLCIKNKNDNYSKYKQIKQLIEKSGILNKSETKKIEQEEILESEVSESEEQLSNNEIDVSDTNKESMYSFENKDDAINVLEKLENSLEEEVPVEENEVLEEEPREELLPVEEESEEVLEEETPVEELNSEETEEILDEEPIEETLPIEEEAEEILEEKSPVEEQTSAEEKMNISELLEQAPPMVNNGLFGSVDYNELIKQQSKAAFSHVDESLLEDVTDDELIQMAEEATNPEDLSKPINNKDLKDIGKKLEQKADEVIKEEEKKETALKNIDKTTFELAGSNFGIIRNISKLGKDLTNKFMSKIKQFKINPGTIKELDSQDLNNGRGI